MTVDLRVDPPITARPIVLLVSHSAAGGAQELWMDLALGFARRGHKVALWALYPWAESSCPARVGLDWTYIVPVRPSGVTGYAKLMHQLVQRIRREQPAMIISALPAANIAAAAAARAARVGTAVVTTHHSPSSTYNRVLDKIDGLTATLAPVTDVVCVSNAVRASHNDKSPGYRAKLRTITNALPPKIEAQIERLTKARGPRLVPRGRTVVAAGRLATQKNYGLLLQAAALATTVRIEIVGDGPQGPELRAMATQLGVIDHVHFWGQKTREETLAIVDEADVFVQVSLFEGHSLALVESAKLGLPLIVSDVPVQVEGISARDGSRCGITVPLDDPAALAAAITQLLDRPDNYARRTAQARQLGKEASFDQMVDAYEALLR